jgi:hypothetical protein
MDAERGLMARVARGDQATFGELAQLAPVGSGNGRNTGVRCATVLACSTYVA